MISPNNLKVSATSLNTKYKKFRESKQLTVEQQNRTTVNELLYSMKQSHNIKQLDGLSSSISKLEHYNLRKMATLNKQLQIKSTTYLELVAIDKDIGQLREFFVDVLMNTKDIRFQGLYNGLMDIAFKIHQLLERLSDEDSNQEGNMIMDKLQQQQEKRIHCEKNMQLLFEGLKDTVQVKDQQVKQLESHVRRLQQELEIKMKLVEDKDRSLQECLEFVEKLKQSLKEQPKILELTINESITKAFQKLKQENTHRSNQRSPFETLREQNRLDELNHVLVMQALTIQQFIEQQNHI